MYQTRKTVFDHISEHLKVRQKYSAEHRISTLLRFSVFGNVVFNILLQHLYLCKSNSKKSKVSYYFKLHLMLK